jgi:hypothetical protein
MSSCTTIHEHLEKYLKSEGLHALIPDYRRAALYGLPLPLPLLWVFLYWAGAFAVTVVYGDAASLADAAVSSVLVITSVLAVVAVLAAILQRLSGSLAASASRRLGAFLVLLLILLPAATLELTLRSSAAFNPSCFASALSLLVVLVPGQAPYRVHLLVALLTSLLKNLGRSVALLPVTAPLLLVVILLSVFSVGLWRALAGASDLNLAHVFLLLAIPSAGFVYVSSQTVADRIADEIPSNDELVKLAEDVPAISSALHNDFISSEEWAAACEDIRWRDTTGLLAQVLPLVKSRIRRWLVLQVALSALITGLLFFIFFCILFVQLLTPQTIADWTGGQIAPITVTLPVGSWPGQEQLPPSLGIVMRVSLFLALFMAAVQAVNSLGDDRVSRVITPWLQSKADSWLGAGAAYQCCLTPGYQVWQYLVQDKRQGIASVQIVVPIGSSDEAAQRACEHMESRLVTYGRIGRVTAFEKKASAAPTYRLGSVGKSWQLAWNKATKWRHFQELPTAGDDPRYDHFLGLRAIKSGAALPDAWFGATPQAVAVSSQIWDSDADHSRILHAFAEWSGKVLTIDVNLAKRLRASNDYRACLRRVLDVARANESHASAILINLYRRDSSDWLAHLLWNPDLPSVSYGDETVKRDFSDKRALWENGP